MVRLKWYSPCLASASPEFKLQYFKKKKRIHYTNYYISSIRRYTFPLPVTLTSETVIKTCRIELVE
jgi:hypothetical protein